MGKRLLQWLVSISFFPGGILWRHKKTLKFQQSNGDKIPITSIGSLVLSLLIIIISATIIICNEKKKVINDKNKEALSLQLFKLMHFNAWTEIPARKCTI